MSKINDGKASIAHCMIEQTQSKNRAHLQVHKYLYIYINTDSRIVKRRIVITVLHKENSKGVISGEELLHSQIGYFFAFYSKLTYFYSVITAAFF